MTVTFMNYTDIQRKESIYTKRTWFSDFPRGGHSIKESKAQGTGVTLPPIPTVCHLNACLTAKVWVS